MVQTPKLIPEHELLSVSDSKKAAKKYGVPYEKFAKMLETDPQARKLGAKPGNIIAIHMEDPTGSYIKYRLVVKG